MLPFSSRKLRLLGALVSVGLTAALVGVLPSAEAKNPAGFGCSSVPFPKAKKKSGPFYRVPSIVRTPNGVLVAFAESRNNNTSDTGNFDVAEVRSFDDGCHWTKPHVIQNPGKDRASNPSPVVDATTGSIFLFTTVRDGTNFLYISESKDDGATWSTPEMLKYTATHPRHTGLRSINGWKGGQTVPGNGIQLKYGEHAGRLIFLMGYTGSNKKYGAVAFYSDDHGITWNKGFDVQAPSKKVQLIEGTITELADGRLFVSYRDKATQKPGKSHYMGISADGGQSFVDGKFHVMKKLPMISVYSNTFVPTGTYSNLLILSGPSVVNKKDLHQRRDLGFFVSTNAGVSWNKKVLKAPTGEASYSDMVQLDDATIGVIYESGVRSWKEKITFRQVQLASIANPPKVKKK